MSKSLVLGNGTLTVGLDEYAQVKDCYFDYVGLENQMGEQTVNRIGIWVDGAFSWFSDGSWNFEIDYKNETLIGATKATNNNLQLEIEITDCVYNERSIFIRHFIVKNNADHKRTIKLFLNHEFEMYRTPKGDTVYFDPNDNTIVHYKGRRIAIIGGLSGNMPFGDYTVGLAGIEGKQGTWVDAEDGSLSKNAIEHGNVDSTISFEQKVEGGGSLSVVNWISFAKTIAEAKELNQYALKRSPGRLCETAEDFWRAWVNKMEFSFHGLSANVIKLFKRSLLISRVHVGNAGEVIASVDSDMLQWGRDNYNYVWPRDGAYVAMSFDRANFSEVSRKFFEFANDVISEEGYFFHKYRPDKSIGSSWHGWVGANGNPQLPIQEDETAIVLVALWHHYQKTKDIEFIEKIYNSLIKKAASFLVGFRGENKLPFESFDLWEMKMGTHTYTVATVYEALIAAGEFAKLLGKVYEEESYIKAAHEIKEASEVLWNEKENYFVKCIGDNSLDTSAFLGAFKFNLFDEIKVQKAFKTLNERLISNEGIGGVVRFENDEYFKQNPNSRGNPWVITTLWRAQYLLKIAKSEKDLKEVNDIFEWVVSHALGSGVLSEQFSPSSGYQLSAAPLAWSHAEFVTTVVMFLEKCEELGLCKAVDKKSRT